MSIPKKTHPFLSSSVSPWLFVFIIVSLGCLYFFSLRPGHDWGDDFAGYIHHAKNIAEGRPYQDVQLVRNPFHRVELRAFPPVFPFFLSFVYRFFGLNLFAMKALVIVFWAGALLLLLFFFRKKISGPALVALLVAIGLYPLLWNFFNNILSETTFIFFTLLSFCLAEYGCGSKASPRMRFVFFSFLGLTMYLAYGTRTVGAVVALAVVACDFVRNKRFRPEMVLAILVFCFFVLCQTFLTTGTADYFRTFNFQPKTGLINIARYFNLFYFLNKPGLESAVFFIKLVLAAIGFYSALRKNISVVEFFVLFYAGILLTRGVTVNPFDMIRFFIPLMPFYFYYVFLGAKSITLAVHRKALTAVVWFFLVLMISLSATSAIAGIKEKSPAPIGVGQKDAVALFEYIKKDTQCNDVFVFIKPRSLSLFTDRPVSLYYPHREKKAFFDYLVSIKAQYVVVNREGDQYLKEFIQAYPEKATNVYENTSFQVFKISLF